MLPLHTHGTLSGDWPGSILKVLTLAEALGGAWPFESILLDLRGEDAPIDPAIIAQLGIGAVLTDDVVPGLADLPSLRALSNAKIVAPGDVVRVRARGMVSVLYRRGANANFLFATERCNSLCLMCSQPPRDVDDAWRIPEILQTIPLIDRDIPAIGLTGGEPTLLGPALGTLIDAVMAHLPDTAFNILTNARQLADTRLANAVCREHSPVIWAVPLYADTARRHDYVVQADDAFEETLNGLYNLAERKQAIELRMVVHKQTVDRLAAFSAFVWRNLPFVSHVAFMGLEPTGLARGNRGLLYVDPADYREALEDAAFYLHDRGIRTSIYNTPLCTLSLAGRTLARKSISDWKNIFAPACDVCALKESCCGFFKSADEGWRSRAIEPQMEKVTA